MLIEFAQMSNLGRKTIATFSELPLEQRANNNEC